MDFGAVLSATKNIDSFWGAVFNILGVIIASSIVIEISPIKINPIKAFFGLISRGFKSWFAEVIDDSLDKQLEKVQQENKKRDDAIQKMDVAIDKMDTAIENINEKIDQITDRMDSNEDRAQKNHISLVRNNILAYANSLRDGMNPSKESFDNILDQIDEYNTWHDATEERRRSNGKAVMSIKFLQEQYDIRFNKVPEQSKKS